MLPFWISISFCLAAQADPLVMVVDRHRDRLLGAALADDVLLQLFGDLFRAGVLRALLRLFLGDDVVAQGNAFVADEDPRAGDQLADFTPALAAKGAVKVIHLDTQSLVTH